MLVHIKYVVTVASNDHPENKFKNVNLFFISIFSKQIEFIYILDYQMLDLYLPQISIQFQRTSCSIEVNSAYSLL